MLLKGLIFQRLCS
ncbi:hypothetical protein ACZ87_03722, partial [Candidatus Erwinia dacicola]